MFKIKFEPTNNKVGCFVYTDLKVVKKDQINEIKELLNKYGVLFFKNQSLSPEEYINFSSNFGTPAEYPMLKPHKDFKNIYVIERKKTDTGKSFGEGAHTDSSYLENPPRFTFLQAIDVPEEGKGNTLFYNQFLAYEALPKDIKEKIENLKGVFSSQGKIAQTRELRMADHGTSGTREMKSEHRLVQCIDGRKTIYCSPGHVIGIVNLNSEQEELINFLSSHQIKENFSYSFGWKKGDIALWSNRSMLHAATAFNGNRKMFRITIQ
tara:strand:- start:1192 stop:1989 length:798 start_codon:yes stop_codon:yes gene_type:complete